VCPLEPAYLKLEDELDELESTNTKKMQMKTMKMKKMKMKKMPGLTVK